MVEFHYKAIGRDGKSKDGVIDVPGPEFVATHLRAQGLTLLKLQEDSEQDLDAENGAFSRAELLSFTTELAVMLRAGLPLDRSLKVLIDMAVQPASRFILSDLLKSVKGGKSLSSSLENHQDTFGGFYISMIRAGEASGQMSEILDRLVEYLEQAKANRDTVISALVYPAILLFVAVLSVFFMLGFVVPQFEALFADMGEALPAITRLVIGLGDFIASWGWLLLVLMFIVGWILRQWLSGDQGRETLHRKLLGLPLVGHIIFEFEIAKFARALGTLLINGVSMLKAISIAVDTVDNKIIRESLQVLSPTVKSGQRISNALEENKLFTPMVIQMLRVGEESGNLDQMMLELAKVFDDHVQSGIKRGLTLLEPLLILVMGAMIASIIIAILMGILSVNDLAI